MNPRNIRELIHFLYGKYVRGLDGPDLEAFVRFPHQWKRLTREDEELLGTKVSCVYCGRTEGVRPWPVIPPQRAGGDQRLLHILRGKDNLVPTCEECVSAMGERDVLEWHPRLEDIPREAMFAFLKLAYQIHLTQGTLDSPDPNMDGRLDLHDLAVALLYFALRREP
ncbi:MAG: hypothetical protein ABIM74_00795 [candidate division WOR-3 bacterium]